MARYTPISRVPARGAAGAAGWGLGPRGERTRWAGQGGGPEHGCIVATPWSRGCSPALLAQTYLQEGSTPATCPAPASHVHPLLVPQIRGAKAPRHGAQALRDDDRQQHCRGTALHQCGEAPSPGPPALLAMAQCWRRGGGGAGRRPERAACGLPRRCGRRRRRRGQCPARTPLEPSARRPRIEYRPMTSRATGYRGHGPRLGRPESRSEKKIAERPQKNKKTRCCWQPAQGATPRRRDAQTLVCLP